MGGMGIYKYGGNSTVVVIPHRNIKILTHKKLKRTWNCRSNELKAQVA